MTNNEILIYASIFIFIVNILIFAIPDRVKSKFLNRNRMTIFQILTVVCSAFLVFSNLV